MNEIFDKINTHGSEVLKKGVIMEVTEKILIVMQRGSLLPSTYLTPMP
jgi:hypothetical protein